MKKAILSSYVLVGLFVLLALIRQNYEFVGYALILAPFILVVHLTDKHFDYNPLGLWGLNIWMLSHLLGGLASIGNVRLYDYMIINLVGEPYSILKYDQVVHLFCYVVMALLFADVVGKSVNEKVTKATVAVIIILGATGIGAINEIIEFAMVVFLNNQGVGGYHNTAIDIVANFLGAIIGTWIALSKKF